MSQAVEHVFAVIGCVTVAVGAATGILKLKGSLTRHDDEP
jgi:hypothetical protein